MTSTDLQQADGSGSGFENIPEILMMEIFKYLDTKDIWRVGGVCSKWWILSRSAQKYDIAVTSTQFYKFVFVVPPYVTDLKICFEHRYKYQKPLVSLRAFADLCKFCPLLESLHVTNASFSNRDSTYRNHRSRPILERPLFKRFRLKLERNVRHMLPSDMHVETETDFYKPVPFPGELRVLSVRNSERVDSGLFNFIPFPEESPLQVLDLSFSKLEQFTNFSLLCPLRNLQELYLEQTKFPAAGVDYILKVASNLKVLDLEYPLEMGYLPMRVLERYGRCLEKLYLRHARVSDFYFSFESRNPFPRLTEICLQNTLVFKEGFRNLLTSCHSLKTIKITRNEIPSFFQAFDEISAQKFEVYPSDETFKTCDHFRINNP